MANVAEEVEQLIPVKATGFGGADGRHFAGIKGIKVDGDVGVCGESVPGKSGGAFGDVS